MPLPAISFVQSALVLNGVTVPFGGGNVAGNAIIVNVLQQGSSAISTSFKVTDTNNNSYRSLGLLSNGDSSGNAAVGEMFCAFNIAGGGNVVNARASNGVPSAVIIAEISGVNAVDVSNSGTGSGTVPSSGSVNTSAADEFLFGWEVGIQSVQLSVSGAIGWTTIQNNISFITQYRIVSAQGPYDFTTNTTVPKGNLNQWATQIATFFFTANAQPRVQGVSQASVGTLLYPNYNNIAWSQPAGKNGQVFPTQANNTPFTAFPVPGMVIDEVGMSLWPVWGCGHGTDVARIFKDFDTDTQTQCAVIACPLCSYVQYLISPYENATSSISSWTQFPIIIP